MPMAVEVKREPPIPHHSEYPVRALRPELFSVLSGESSESQARRGRAYDGDWRRQRPNSIEAVTSNHAAFVLRSDV